MVVLVATIVIAVIIMSVSIVSINNATKNAALVTFTEELTNIEGAVEEYYLLNGELPFLNNTQYTLSEISAESFNSSEFTLEVNTNNDNDNYFVKIDLTKLDFEKAVRGTLRYGEDDNDVYVIAYPSFNVYYLKGVNIGSVNYFSLANLQKTEEISQNEQSNETSMYSGDLYVKKSTNNWSNTLNLEISTYIVSGNTLSIQIPNDDSNVIEKNLTTTINTTNTITINTLSAVGYSSQEITNFNNLEQSKKKIIIIKKEGTNVVGRVEVDMSNYDTVLPVINGQISKSSYEKYNTVSFNVSDSLSKIDQVRYEYLEKTNYAGTSNYFENNSYYDKANLIKNGKIAEIDNDVVTIKLPKNVTKIKCVVIDKAGNSTNVTELDTKSPIFIGYNTVSGTTSSMTFNAKVEANSTVTDFRTAISVDGVNYTSDYVHGAIDTLTNFTYSNIQNMYDYIFIKITVVCGGTEEIRIIQVDTSNFLDEGTRDKANASWSKPYIPEGFVHIEGTVTTGYVIQDTYDRDTKYSEFVWVPVDYIYNNTPLAKGTDSTKTKLQNLRTGWLYGTDVSTVTALASGYEEPYSGASSQELAEYNTMIQSIETYGGFYVARYEAGDLGATAARTDVSGITNKVVSKKGAYVYNFVTWGNAITDYSGGAVELSRDMYKYSSDIFSHLIYGAEWDTLMHWATMDGKNVSNSISWGNYPNSIGDAAINCGLIQKTGTNETWKTHNIYDLAGNVYEWTMETVNSTYRVNRSGSYSRSDTSYATIRDSAGFGFVYEHLGFRPVLYIK